MSAIAGYIFREISLKAAGHTEFHGDRSAEFRRDLAFAIMMLFITISLTVTLIFLKFHRHYRAA